MSYGTFRQHNYNSSKSLNNSFTTLLDTKSVDKFLNYNYNLVNNPSSNLDVSQIEGVFRLQKNSKPSNLVSLNHVLNSSNTSNTSLNLEKLLYYPSYINLLSSENDAKQFKNPFKYLLNDN